MNSRLLKFIDGFSKKSRWIILVIGIISFFVLAFSLFLLWRDGPRISSDTIGYFKLAENINFGITPQSHVYSIGYPIILSYFSNLFKISIENSSIIVCSLNFFLAISLLLGIIREISEQSIIECIFPSITIVSFKQFSQVLASAHADGLMLVFHLGILYFLILLLKRASTKSLVLLCFLLFFSLWIKLNNLIYLFFIPLIMIRSQWQSNRLKFIFFPIFSLIASLIIIIFFNGGLHFRFSNKNSVSFILSEKFFEILKINLIDLFQEISALLLNPIVVQKFDLWISIFAGSFILFFVVKILKDNTLNFGQILSFYIIFYLSFLVGFQSYSGVTEINQRTLVTLNLSLILLVLFWIFTRNQKFIFIFLISCFFNLSLVLVSGYSLFKNSSNNNIGAVKTFYSRPSLVLIKSFLEKAKYQPQNIYSNFRRPLSFALNYQFVNELPGDFYFNSGKMKFSNTQRSDSLRIKIISEVRLKRAVIVLFDPKPSLKSRYFEYGLDVLQINDDFLIY